MSHATLRPLRMVLAAALVVPLAVLALVFVPFLQWGLAAWSFVVRSDLQAARRADALPSRVERLLRGLWRRVLDGRPLRG